MQLTLGEDQLLALREILRRLVDATAFNATVTLEIARIAGAKMPYEIEVVNDQTKELLGMIDAAFQGVFDVNQ